MQMPLYDKCREYARKDVYPFHMPGHKGGRLLMEDAVFHMDITEIPGFDNLHHCDGVIREAQQACARVFGAEESFFLVNGSTCGLEAAVLTVCSDNDKLLVARNCHKAIYSGCILSGANPVYFMPEFLDYPYLPGGIAPRTVEQIISENRDAKAVILTSPTYEGFVSDIKGIAEIVHQNNMALIVDEAHGAHFVYDGFPTSAVHMGADIVIQSLHKTLPAPTQTALLHVSGQRIDRTRLREMLSLVQTSSPSYLFMTAMDRLRAFVEGKEGVRNYLMRLENFRSKMEKLQNIRLLGRELCHKSGIADLDIGKLVFYFPNGQTNGTEIERLLSDKYKIQVEASSPDTIIAMTSVADSQEGFDRLQKAMFAIDGLPYNPCQKRRPVKRTYLSKPEISMPLRQAAFSPKRTFPWEEAIGKAAGEFAIPYPPGIPLIAPGEKITKKIIDNLKYCIDNNLIVTGLSDKEYNSIKVIEY